MSLFKLNSAITSLLIILNFAVEAAGEDLMENLFQVKGLKRTNLSVIETEVAICNCLHKDEQLKQTLLGTGLFQTVDIFKLEDGQTQIVVEEKWTTIPILKFNSGGGVKQTTIGVYDPNVLGKRIELGLQYESLSKAPSWVAWNKIPRLFGSRFFSDLQFWDTSRIRLKYNQAVETAELTKALLHESEKIYFAIGYDFISEFRLRLTLEQNRDRFTTDFIPSNTLSLVSGQIIPPPSDFVFVGTQLEWGRLEIVNNSPKGNLVSLSIKQGHSNRSEQNDFISSHFEVSSYTHWGDLLYAFRFRLGMTDSKVLQYWNYLGGLDSIRGFVDNRFASAHYWNFNNEVRKFVSEDANYIFQAAAFLDTVGINEAGNKLQNLHAASVGLGGRLILPKFYRVIVRLDLAQPILKKDSESVSVGIQQFF